MKLEFYTNGVISVIDLDSLAAEHAGIINIGQKCKHVWNAVKIDDESVDPFQLLVAINSIMVRSVQNAPRDCLVVVSFLAIHVREDV